MTCDEATNAILVLCGEVLAEVERAMIKFPSWPTDPIHAAAVVGEEAGELTKAVLEAVYEPHKSTMADAREEALQTAAMALRFVLAMPHYVLAQSPQVLQYDDGSAVQ